MKKILLSIVALCCTVVAGAQSTDQISAILQVDDQTTVYYGATALSKAIQAAPDHGGVITLSSGLFNAVTINKDVKIYGAGYETNTDNGIVETNINGTCTINLPAEIAGPHDICIEGVYINRDLNVASAVDGLSLTKSSVYSLTFSAAATSCVVTQSYIRYSINSAHDLYVQNSYVRGSSISVRNDESNILLNHCIVIDGYNFDRADNRFTCTNCILNVGYRNTVQTYTYCLIPNWKDLNGFVGSTNNWFDIGVANVFDDAENTDYTADRTFILKDPSTYKGSDGTQVGVNGGDFPWNKIPSTPIVKNLKATVNGANLGVEYEADVR